jgi:hypothetical protein
MPTISKERQLKEGMKELIDENDRLLKILKALSTFNKELLEIEVDTDIWTTTSYKVSSRGW